MKSPIEISLNFLKFRPRTVFEITEKLKSKNIPESEIKETIIVLKRNGLLDDENFAKMWVRDRNLLKPTGSFLLKLELKKLGIAEALIENVILDQDEEELAKQAIEMKGRYREVHLGSTAESRRAEFEKKAQFLQRRGFSMNTIYKVLKK